MHVALVFPLMSRYSLALEGPDGETYVVSHEFEEEMHSGDTFAREGVTWQVIAVAAKQQQFDAPDEPAYTLRCVPAPAT
jgi:hypothetical protein